MTLSTISRWNDSQENIRDMIESALSPDFWISIYLEIVPATVCITACQEGASRSRSYELSVRPPRTTKMSRVPVLLPGTVDGQASTMSAKTMLPPARHHWSWPWARSYGAEPRVKCRNFFSLRFRPQWSRSKEETLRDSAVDEFLSTAGYSSK